MKWISLLVILSLSALTSCGGSGAGTDAPSGSLSQAGQALSTLDEAVKASQLIQSGSSSFVGFTAGNAFGPEISLSAAWADDSAVSDLSNTGTASYRTWMGDQMNPDFTNDNGAKTQVFGRFENVKEIVCMISQMITTTDSTGLAADGTYDVVPTTSAAELCGMDASDVESITNVNIVVSTPSDTTTYDKTYVMNGYAGATQQFDYTMKIRKTSSVINVQTAEDQTIQGRVQGSRVTASYDVTNQILRFEYISLGFDTSDPSGYEFYRIYNDEVNKDVRILGHYGGNDNTNYIQYALAGDPTDTTKTVALSITGVGNTTNIANGTACIDPSDGSISTDNSLACSTTGTAVSANANAMMEAWRAARASGTTSTAETNLATFMAISDTAAVTFTSTTDIFTAAPN
jgi:hypothetical protein